MALSVVRWQAHPRQLFAASAAAAAAATDDGRGEPYAVTPHDCLGLRGPRHHHPDVIGADTSIGEQQVCPTSAAPRRDSARQPRKWKAHPGSNRRSAIIILVMIVTIVIVVVSSSSARSP
eukprot:3028116-Rhodomonas_salina.3